MKDDISSTISFDDFKHSKDFFELKISKKYYLFVFSLLAFLITFFIWAAIFDFDIVAKGNVVIRPKEDVSVIKLLNSGIVSEKKYVNGSMVKEGDFLFSLNTDVIVSEIENTKLNIIRNDNKISNLNNLEQMIEGNQIFQDKGEATVRANVYFSEKKMKELSYEKALKAYEIELAIPPEATYKQKIFELKNASDIAKSDLESFIANSKYSLITEKAKLQSEKETLEQNLKQLNKQLSESMIVASKDGIIEELSTFSVGDFLFGGENILRIVPVQNDNIKAQVNLSEKDIAGVKVGQTVKMKLSALKSNEFGQVKGIVTRIGADSMFDSNKNSYYQIEVEIPVNYLKNKSNEISYILPGMTGVARITVRQKKLISYIAEKLSFK